MIANRLKAKIIEKGFTVTEVTKAVGMTNTTFWRKCKGISEFTLKEVKAFKDVLSLTDDEVRYIFFES